MHSSLRPLMAILFGLAIVLAAGPALAAQYVGQPVVHKALDGKTLTAPDGSTLYVYANDKKDSPTCTGSCKEIWPPERAAANAHAKGQFGIIRRMDGTRQWTYEGKPLYGYVKDKKAGDVKGADVPGWFVARYDADHDAHASGSDY